MSYLEVDLDIDKKFSKTSLVWSRLFNRFARGDLIKFHCKYRSVVCIFYNTYKMTNEQIHVQVIAGWGKDDPKKIKVIEFLLWEQEWNQAVLVKKCEDGFDTLREVMKWWESRKTWERKELSKLKT